LKKLSTGLEHLEKERPVTPTAQPHREPTVTVSKRRARPALARKASAVRKRKKAA
jgi:hypothetical protein